MTSLKNILLNLWCYPHIENNDLWQWHTCIFLHHHDQIMRCHGHISSTIWLLPVVSLHKKPNNALLWFFVGSCEHYQLAVETRRVNTLAKSTLMIFKCNNLAWSISLWQAETVKHKHRCIWQSRTIFTSVISKLGARKSYGGVSEIASSVPAHSSRKPMNIRLQCPTHFTSNSHWLRMESGLTFMNLQPFISILKQYQL